MALQNPKSREVEHAIRALDRLLKNVSVQDVAAMREDADTLVSHRLAQVVVRAAEEVVVNHDFTHVGLEQFVHDVTADESRTADDDNLLSCQIHDHS